MFYFLVHVEHSLALFVLLFPSFRPFDSLSNMGFSFLFFSLFFFLVFSLSLASLVLLLTPLIYNNLCWRKWTIRWTQRFKRVIFWTLWPIWIIFWTRWFYILDSVADLDHILDGLKGSYFGLWPIWIIFWTLDSVADLDHILDSVADLDHSLDSLAENHCPFQSMDLRLLLFFFSVLLALFVLFLFHHCIE